MNELRKVKVIVPHIKLEKTNIHTRNKKARISCFNPNHIRHMNQVKGKPTIIHLSKTILAFGCREHPFKWETINQTLQVKQFSNTNKVIFMEKDSIQTDSFFFASIE